MQSHDAWNPSLGVPGRVGSCHANPRTSRTHQFFHKQAYSTLPRADAMACKDGVYPEAAPEPERGLGVSPRQVLEKMPRMFQPADTGEACARFSRHYGSLLFSPARARRCFSQNCHPRGTSKISFPSCYQRWALLIILSCLSKSGGRTVGVKFS